jgi:hypothetical protein
MHVGVGVNVAQRGLERLQRVPVALEIVIEVLKLLHVHPPCLVCVLRLFCFGFSFSFSFSFFCGKKRGLFREMRTKKKTTKEASGA